MKYFIPLHAAILAATVLPTAAAAAGITYDCDTAPGHFSDLILPAPSGHFVVTGTVQVLRIGTDAKWAPMVRVRIGSAEPALGSAPADYAGVELTAVPGKTVSMAADTVQLFSFDTKGGKLEAIPSSLGPIGAGQQFRMDFDGQSVAVSVAGQSRSYPLKGESPIVELVCSTGEFLFTNVTIQPSG